MNKSVIVLGVALGSALFASAETPLWLRDVKISPDGTRIAFSYKGDIYSVPSAGGEATRLTSVPSYEHNPVWSPDGTKIAFASDRNGGSDVYVMPSSGGTPMRLTYHSAAETPETFTPDGRMVVFSAAIQAPARSVMFPSRALSELYQVPADGSGRFTQILGTPALYVNYIPDGTGSFLYEDVKGMENRWRKHHTSSVTSDIWLYDAATGHHTNLTGHDGEDRNPVISTDGKTVYFLSERAPSDALNVYSFPLDNPSQIKQLTDFRLHPVRFLSVGNDGTLAFAWNGEIYTKRGTSAPEKVIIDIITDMGRPIEAHTATSANEATVSPSGKQLAYVSRGEVFVTDVEYSSTKQITDTPEAESDVTWGQNDRELYYTSERDGKYNIYKATIRRADDPNFSNATVVDEWPVFPADGHERTMPSLSPDGKYLAFILDRNKLMVMDTDTHKVRELTDGSTQARRTKGFSAHWSPDSRYIAIGYTEKSHDPYGDIAIIEVADGKLTKITATGYFDDGPKWVLGGEGLLFLSERYGMRSHASWGSQFDVMLAFLTKDAYDKYRMNEEDYALLKEVEKARKKSAKKSADGNAGKKKSAKDDKKGSDTEAAKKQLVFDLDNVEERTVRLTPNSADISDAILSKDGETLYYLAAFEGGYDLWKHKLRKHETKVVNKLDGSGMGMEMDSVGNIFLIGSQVKKFDPKTEKLKSVGIKAKYELDPAKEREYMLRHVYNEEKERFYTPSMHGVDWDSLYTDYKRFLPHINNNYDFSEMLSELLGELNVSHTGSGFRGPQTKDPVGRLGLMYDWTYPGPGLKVDEVLAGGPFDSADSKMRGGATITSINGIELDGIRDPLTLLVGTSGKKTLVAFTNPDGSRAEEVVLPVTDSRISNLLYKRWVRRNEHTVDSLSGGRLGYVHIQSMDDASYRKIYADMLGKYVDREGIVIDTRWNGGGRLHEDIEVLFSGKTYLTQDVHGVTTSVMPSRRWNKPSIMLICEANYSNAHGTPWVYSHLGLGKLVGMPVPGTMTSVNWVTLQDPSLYFGIPVVGFRTAEGNYLENTQLEPDVRVANDPADVVLGIDSQLKAAVGSLLNEIDK